VRHEQYRIAILKGKRTREVDAHLEACVPCARLHQALILLQEVPPPPPDLEAHVPERPSRRTRHRHRPQGLPLRPARRRLLASLATLFVLVAVPVLVPLFWGLVPGSDSDEAVAMVPFTPDCERDSGRGQGAAEQPGDGRLRGQRVVVAGVWKNAEADKFRKVLERFEQETGADVRYAYETRRIADRFIGETIRSRLEHDCPPDVALLPQPGLLRDLARNGDLAPIDFAEAAVRQNYRRFWQRLGSVDGRLYGVWFKAANKSALWYSRRLFDKANVRPPRSWRDLLKVAEKLRRAKTVPFSVGGADGWTLTDWFENVYLGTAGPRRYDELTRNKIPWTHPTVRKALATLSEIFARHEWLAGGTRGALRTTYEQSVSKVFAQREAAIVFEGDFVANELTGSPQAKRDAGVFEFPPIDGPKPVVVGGDVAVLFRKSANNEAAKELIRFLAQPESAEPWARSGGLISPNKGLDTGAYRDATARRLAKTLLDAKTLRFDLSDLQPPAFGATPEQGMWKLFRDYLRTPRRADAITAALQPRAAAAVTCDRALEGEC